MVSVSKVNEPYMDPMGLDAFGISFFICFQGSNKHKQSRIDPFFAGHPSKMILRAYATLPVQQKITLLSEHECFPSHAPLS